MLSGYLERPSGGPLVFSLLANHYLLGSVGMVAALDSVLTIIGR
jgi:D-alanyl-D-alanine carboxypeptidase